MQIKARRSTLSSMFTDTSAFTSRSIAAIRKVPTLSKLNIFWFLHILKQAEVAFF